MCQRLRYRRQRSRQGAQARDLVSRSPLVCPCVVMTVILSPSKCFLFPQCPASHLREEATPTGQEAINSFLFLGAFPFGAAIAACWCQCMTCQGLGYHTQLLDMWMRFH